MSRSCDKREVLYFALLDAVERGKDFRTFQKKMAKRFGISEGAVYQRHLHLVKSIQKEEAEAKTARKGQLRKLLKLITFPSQVEIQTKSESVVDTLARVYLNRRTAHSNKKKEEENGEI